MFLILLRRELLANLMTFRFFVAMIVCLLLVVANSMVLIGDYERRLADYNTAVQIHREEAKAAKTYSFLNLQVDRPPNPLSIFNQGLDRRLGNTIGVSHGAVPSLWDAESHSADNPFLNLFSSIDLVFIFQIVLSLLALLFAYDAIAGEREGGTLRLMMTNSISRSLILLAKYVSAMLCLILPLIISLLLSLVLFTTSRSIALSGDDWGRIGGILLTSMVYLSAFYLIGLLISTTSRRTATALMLSMFVWAFLTLIYPSVDIFTMNRFWSMEDKLKPAYGEIEQIWERFEKERMDFLKNDPVEGESRSFNMSGSMSSTSGSSSNSTKLQYSQEESSNWGKISDDTESRVPYVKTYYQFLEPLRIRTAERAWLVRQKALEDTYVRKAKVARNLMRLSPAAMYDLATEAWAGTDLREIEDFITQVKQYRQTIIAYFYDKGAFSSRQWFASDQGKVSWDDLPQFSYHRADVSASATAALPDLMFLLLLNVALFMGIFLIFIKQEV